MECYSPSLRCCWKNYAVAGKTLVNTFLFSAGSHWFPFCCSFCNGIFSDCSRNFIFAPSLISVALWQQHCFDLFYFSKQQSATGDSVTRYIRISRPLIFIPLNSLFLWAEHDFQSAWNAYQPCTDIFDWHRNHSVFDLSLIQKIFPFIFGCKITAERTMDSLDACRNCCIGFIQTRCHPEIDWFEDGNRILPLQQWFQFGKILSWYFSVHMRFPIGVGEPCIRCWTERILWGFCVWIPLGPIVSVLIYFLDTSSEWQSFYRIVYRVVLSLHRFSHSILLPSCSTYRNFINPSFKKSKCKNYFLFPSLVVHDGLRIDLGISNFIAGVRGLLLVWYCVPNFKIQMTSLKKAALYTGISVFFIFVLL